MGIWISGYFENNLSIISLVRFLAYFLTGGIFYLCREWMVFRWLYVLPVTGLAILSLINPLASRVFLPTAGGYLLFYMGFMEAPFLKRARLTPDISYGVYLYGWPTQKIFIVLFGITSPYLLFSAALPVVALFGLLSWKLIEEPSLRRKTGSIKLASI
jgi:peptidoglycan/LPS O-acetylase OafA/YrhL